MVYIPLGIHLGLQQFTYLNAMARWPGCLLVLVQSCLVVFIISMCNH